MLVLALVLTAGSTVPAAAVDTGSIAGTVTDAATAAPIAQATVYVYDVGAALELEPVTTGPDGGYDIDLPPGPYRVAFAADGYIAMDYADCSVEASKTTVIDAALTPVVTAVSGSVIDTETALPVPGLEIEAMREGDGDEIIFVGSTMTDAHGLYRFTNADLEPGTYYIHTVQNVAADDRFYWERSSGPIEWDGITARTDVDFAVTGEGYSLIAHVRDADGYPVDYIAEGMVPVLTRAGDPAPITEVGHHFTEHASGKITWYFLDGEYRFGLPGNERYEARWYGGASSWSAATVFSASPSAPANLGTITLAEKTVPVDPALEVVGVAGPDRYATAIAGSKLAYPSGLDAEGERTVIIATGANWPDALGGASLAGVLDGPVLLVDGRSLSTAVATEIGRLNADKAIVLGGTSAVSTAVEAALENRLGQGKVQRIAGPDRYRTADAIAMQVIAEMDKRGGFEGAAFIATGGNFPDALAAAPLAAKAGWPLLLADPVKGLLPSTAEVMKSVHRRVVLGGPSVVPASVTGQRLAGADRYATAVAVAGFGVGELGLSWDRCGIATGQNFPDALAGGVVQGKRNSVMLLTRSTTLEPVVAQSLVRHKAHVSAVTYYGGTTAVSPAVRTAVENALKK